MKKADSKKFEESFIFYYCRKRPNGKQELKESSDYVKQLAGEYYQKTISNIYPSDYKQFFAWLATEEPYFVDEYKFKQRVSLWRNQRREIKATDEISTEFLDYIRLYGIIADNRHLKESPGVADCPYRQLSILTSNMEVRPLKQRFAGKSPTECFQAFFALLQEYGISADVVDEMEKRMRAASDEANEARASGIEEAAYDEYLKIKKAASSDCGSPDRPLGGKERINE